MRVDVYSIMRNERLLVPYFLRHYETFADRIFVWDDQSDDGTRDILKAHPKVVLLALDHHGADDIYYIKHLWPQYRKISRDCADWVFCVDCDEFVWHPEMRHCLEWLTARRRVKLKIPGFMMLAHRPPTTEGQIYEEIKRGLPDILSTKTIVFNPKIEINWRNGRHMTHNSWRTPTFNDHGMKLLHYRFLGLDYMKARNEKNFKNMGIRFDNFTTLPDGTKGSHYDWYQANKRKAKRIVP